MAKAQATAEPPCTVDVFRPADESAYLTAGDSKHLADKLYVSDFLMQFAKVLGIKAAGYIELEDALTSCSRQTGDAGDQQHYQRTGGGSCDATAAAGQAWLTSTYTRLLQIVLEDYEGGRREARWLAALQHAGTWPEVLRRFVQERQATSEEVGTTGLVDQDGECQGRAQPILQSRKGHTQTWVTVTCQIIVPSTLCLAAMYKQHSICYQDGVMF